MVITHSHTQHNGRFASNIIAGLLGQSSTRWQELPISIWPSKRLEWFDVELPFRFSGRGATLVHIQSRVGEPATRFIAEEIDARFHAFHDWLNSIPPVPHVSLEALDRGNLY